MDSQGKGKGDTPKKEKGASKQEKNTPKQEKNTPKQEKKKDKGNPQTAQQTASQKGSH